MKKKGHLSTRPYQTEGMCINEKLSNLEYNLNISRIDRLPMGGSIFTEEKHFLVLIIETHIEMIKKKYCS
jgi:hypothetical protein